MSNRDYTIEYVNGEYVQVPKRRATRVVRLEAAVVRGSNWRVWGTPRGRERELFGDRMRFRGSR